MAAFQSDTNNYLGNLRVYEVICSFVKGYSTRSSRASMLDVVIVVVIDGRTEDGGAANDLRLGRVWEGPGSRRYRVRGSRSSADADADVEGSRGIFSPLRADCSLDGSTRGPRYCMVPYRSRETAALKV